MIKFVKPGDVRFFGSGDWLQSLAFEVISAGPEVRVNSGHYLAEPEISEIAKRSEGNENHPKGKFWRAELIQNDREKQEVGSHPEPG